MPTAVCPSDEDLKAYAWGELPLQHEDELADHLEACSRCESAMQTLERQETPLLARLRMPVKPDPYLEEPACRQVVQRLLAGKDDRTHLPEGPEENTQIGPTPSAASAALACPGRFLEYDLLEKLGEGGMGTVYKARHQRLKRLVAIKILRPSLAQDPQRIARFKREMKAVGQLDHAHIVRAMDAGEAEGRHYLVMEYVEGLDLSKIVDRIGPLAVADACEIVRQVAVGLRAADERGLIHRDIKPSNLMLAPDGQVKIFDLGLAVFETDRSADGETTAAGQIMGTPDYIAPEQIHDAHSVDARADIYSLGCTLYKLLTGHAPFTGTRYRSVADKMAAHLRDPVPPIRTLLPQVPEKLAAVLDRMLVKDRDLRIPTPGRLVDELAAFCVGSDLAGLLDLAQKGLPENSPLPPGATNLRSVPGVRAVPAGPAISPPSPNKFQSPQGSSGAPAVVAAVNMTKDVKKTDFDPYYKWLGIPPTEQPPNHYRLLGLQVFERDPEVILAAVMRQSAHLKTYQLGQHAALTQKLLNEVSAAKVSLLDPQRKAAYDARLRKGLEAQQKAPPRRIQSDIVEGDGHGVWAYTPPTPAGEGQGERAFRAVKTPWLSHLRQRCRSAVPPRFRTRGWLAAAGGAAILFAGIFAAVLIVRIRDKQGNVVGELQVPEGGTAELTESQISNTKSEISNLKSPPPPLAIAPFGPNEAKEHQAAWAKYAGVPVSITNSIGMQFVWIPAGRFMLGSSTGEEGHARNELWHRVTLTKGFYLGVREVTRGEFAQFAKATGYRTQAESEGGGRFWTGGRWNSDPSINWKKPEFDQSDDHPVVCISWNDAVAFAHWLSVQDREGRNYRLPTEAEWEYACRAGTETAYCSGDDLDALKNVGWCSYDGRWNSAGCTKPVGQFQANAWGLYDMHGNAYEWCHDWMGEYSAADQVDPEGPAEGTARVLRGGSWGRDPLCCRSACRNGHEPSARDHHLGFRLAMVPAVAAEKVPAAGAAAADKTPKPQPVPQAADPDRQAAQWLRSINAEVDVELASGERKHFGDGALPDSPFRIVTINLWNRRAVTDRDLSKLRGLDRLERIETAGTQTSDETLKVLSELPNLAIARCGFAPYTDEGVKCLGRLKKLRELHLCGTKVTDAGMEGLRESVTLEYLNLNGTPFKGPGLAHLAKLATKLGEFWLNETQIDDAGLASLPSLCNLKHLHIARTQITDAGLEHLRKLPNLENLGLQGTKVTALGLLTLHQALPNCKFEADEAVMKQYDELLKGKPSPAVATGAENAPKAVPPPATASASSPAPPARTPDSLGTPEACEHDRDVAKWALGSAWDLEVELVNGEKKRVRSLPHEPFRIPHEPFRIVGIFLNGRSRVDDKDLECLRGLERLRVLRLIETSLTDEGMKSLCKLESLEELSLDGAHIKGPGFAHLSKMTKLKTLSLSGKQLNDAAIACLPDLPSLQRLQLIGAGTITDATIDRLARFPQLRELSAPSAKVAAEGLLRLHRAVPDCKFVLDFWVLRSYKLLLNPERYPAVVKHVNPAAGPAGADNASRHVSLALKKVHDAAGDPVSVQYAVMEVLKQAGLKCDLNNSLRNTAPVCQQMVRPKIVDQPWPDALRAILDPVGLTYEIKGEKVTLKKK